jgi:hypothetical protein
LEAVLLVEISTPRQVELVELVAMESPAVVEDFPPMLVHLLKLEALVVMA